MANISKAIAKIRLLAGIPILAIGALQAAAQDMPDTPMMTLHSEIGTLGADGQFFTLYINSMEPQSIWVDSGAGPQKVEVDNTNDGTAIPIAPTVAGDVKIYGDPSQIDYLYCQGGYLTAADLTQLVNLDVLDFSHNELEYLDLSKNVNIRYVDLADNKFVDHPLILGKLPELMSLTINHVQTLEEGFSLTDYPRLMIFSAWNVPCIREIDPSVCPGLRQLTLEATGISSLDVTKNYELRILNISETFVDEIDLSQNPNLTEFYCTRESAGCAGYTLKNLDISNNPELVHLFIAGNHLKDIDLSNNTSLMTLSMRRNDLTRINVEGLDALFDVDLSYNNMTISTLPADEGQWYYYFYNQNDMKVDRTYKVGDTIDLSDKVLRDDWPVYMTLLSVSESNPDYPVELDATQYMYADGKITLTEEFTDSVYAEFYTPMLPAGPFATTKFKVKSVEEFGQPVQTIFFTPDASQANKTITLGVGIAGASQENPKKFWVDFGDGELKEFNSYAPEGESANAEGIYERGLVSVLLSQDDEATSFSMSGVKLNGCHVEKAHALHDLVLENTGLYELDLTWNRCLERIVVTGNNFGYFSLEGANSYYSKLRLHHVDMSNNNMIALTLDPKPLFTLNLSGNRLTDIDLSTGNYITDLDLSKNQFEYVYIQPLDALKRLDLSGNKLTSLTPPDIAELESVNIALNNFTLATMPYLPDQLSEFIYAPQQPIQILSKGPGCTLSSQNLVLAGKPTEFVWYTTTGKELVEGVDYSVNQGLTRFLNYDLGKVYCEINNATYPDFSGRKALRTTEMLVAEPPTNLLGEMTVIGYTAGNIPYLSMAGTEMNTTVFIDWSGNGDYYNEYVLGTTYRLFPVDIMRSTAKIYTYEDTDNLTVFSLSDIKLGKIDVSRMSNLFCLGLYDCEAKEVILPENKETLNELSLVNGDYNNLDLEPYSNMLSLCMQYCGLEAIDLSVFPKLRRAFLPNNFISNVLIDNPELESLDLNFNAVSSIDLSKAPKLYQLILAANTLKEIDVEPLKNLGVLNLTHNSFNIATLPLWKPEWYKYYYEPQALIEPDINGSEVDLSSQLWAGDTETVYYWFQDSPWIDENGELAGTQLVEGDDYEFSNGVTTFLQNVTNAVCVMTNEEFPDLYLVTYPITVKGPDSVEEISVAFSFSVNGLTVNVNAEAGVSGSLYTLDGICVSSAVAAADGMRLTAPEPGIYVANIGGNSIKLTLK